MNPRILTSGMTILAVVAAVSGMTYAFFSDSGTSSANVFGTGTFDLKLSDDNEANAENVTATWNNTSLVPGGTPVDATLKLKNSGTVDGNNVHVALANTNSDTTHPMDKFMKITTLEYDSNGDGDFLDAGENILPLITESNANGFADLADWAALVGSHSIPGSIKLDLTDHSVDHKLHMVVGLDSSATNDQQGDTVTSLFTATLHQDASQ
jgi:predicted ribosomally synthesized peptide with SipW-like signal peptide